MRLHAFDMACVGHIQQGMWRHPRDRSAEYLDLGHWVRLARTLERGLFDGLFLADVLGVYDVYEGSAAAALRDAVQAPLLDPMLLVPAMAHATEHLGFGVTANVSYEAPYAFARRMSTLDHLSRGRAGWNVVTGYLDSAARAMGLERQAAHDARYDQADAFMAAVYALWEGSWAEDAVVRDRARGVYAEPGRVRAVRHAGGGVRMEGVHLCEPSPQRTPVLYQAGSSGRGRRFAARHAECVFVNGGARDGVAATVAALRAEAAALGRGRADLLVLMGATVVVAETGAAAAAKLADYQRYASVEGALAHASASMGVDLAAYGDEEAIGTAPTQAIASNLAAVAAQGMTKRRFVDSLALGGRQTPIVGGPEAVADALAGWMEAADLDGFVLARTVAPECFEDFVDLVVPVLQGRGVFKTEYSVGTLREKLFGRSRLGEGHPGAEERFETTADQQRP